MFQLPAQLSHICTSLEKVIFWLVFDQLCHVAQFINDIIWSDDERCALSMSKSQVWCQIFVIFIYICVLFQLTWKMLYHTVHLHTRIQTTQTGHRGFYYEISQWCRCFGKDRSTLLFCVLYEVGNDCHWLYTFQWEYKSYTMS